MGYDPHLLPPDLDISRKHQKATSFQKRIKLTEGQTDPQLERDNLERCPCCLQYTHKEAISLCSGPGELTEFGRGLPLYRWISFFSVFLLIFPLLGTGGYYMWKHSKGSDCMQAREFRSYAKTIKTKINKFYPSPVHNVAASPAGAQDYFGTDKTQINLYIENQKTFTDNV
jgi:hypothetical protein